MYYIETCSLKINISLRVLRKREDGYHEIHSLFWRKRSPEVLEISPGASGDRVAVSGAEIPGENILVRSCCYLRSRYGNDVLPPLAMNLFKHLPMGSGVGAGSGNAAALLRWFERTNAGCRMDFRDVASLGADVAFLASGYDLAFADGIGEILSGVDETLDIPAIVFFPKWASDTRRAYAVLDEQRKRDGAKCDMMDAASAREESVIFLNRLRSGERVGILPNDFISCMSLYESCYDDLYDIVESAGAQAWGLCGSGSACFALFGRRDAGEVLPALAERLSNEASSRFSWLQKIMVLE